MIAWFPLLVLSLIRGQAVSGAEVPFLRDFAVQARLLIALPLMLLAGPFCDRTLMPTLGAFVDEDVIQEKDRVRFGRILASTARWSRSPLAIALLAALTLIASHSYFQKMLMAQSDTWYGQPSGTEQRWTPAGFWYVWVATPLFQFVQFGWYVRLFFWWSMLWRISRLDLHLTASHPDRFGGIGFLENRLYAFAPFLIGQGFVIAGFLSNRIFHEDAHLQDYWPEMAMLCLLIVILVLGPLTSFCGPLFRSKRRARITYGILASRYTCDFERRWIQGGASATEPLLGSADIQSLADLANSFEVVQGMSIVPFGKMAVVNVIVPLLLPIAPLVFTVIPAEELLRKLLSMLV